MKSKLYTMNFLILLSIFSSQLKSEFINNKENPRKMQELSDDIVMLHINDVHCNINNTIGYDGFALYKEELEEKYKYIITVDVGDHVQGDILGSLTNGKQ